MLVNLIAVSMLVLYYSYSSTIITHSLTHSLTYSLTHSLTYLFTHSFSMDLRHEPHALGHTSTSTALVQPPISGRKAPPHYYYYLSDLFVCNCDHKLTPTSQEEGPNLYYNYFDYYHCHNSSITTSSKTRGPGSIHYGSRTRTAGCTAQRCDDTGDP
jgi:hypothetical protein